MIRIKVLKASHLMLWAAAALLVILLLVIFGGRMIGNASTENTDASLVAMEMEEAIYASSFVLPEIDEEASKDEPLPLAVVREEDIPEPETENIKKKLRILIYHTHTHEAYAQVDGDEYVETGAWRTADKDYSVVRVGTELGAILELYGFEVVHDVTDNEMPNFNTAYERSLNTVLSYEEPFDLYIDLHRDAYTSGEERAAFVNGQDVAGLMFLIGDGGNFTVKPDVASNYDFACAVTERLNEKHPGLCRDVMVKSNRYNQHVGTPAVLIEVGHNENTLQEALACIPYLAEALADQLMLQSGGY